MNSVVVIIVFAGGGDKEYVLGSSELNGFSKKQGFYPWIIRGCEIPETGIQHSNITVTA